MLADAEKREREEDRLFTREDIISVARYHRNAGHSRGESSSSARPETPAPAESTPSINPHQQCQAEIDRLTQRLSLEKEVRHQLEHRLSGQAQQTRRNEELEAEVYELKCALNAEKERHARTQERVSKLNGLGLPRAPLPAEEGAGVEKGLGLGLRHTGSLKENRILDPEWNRLMEDVPLPYTPAALQKSRESERIVELEKIVEGQKTVNEELMGKIGEWKEVSLSRYPWYGKASAE